MNLFAVTTAEAAVAIAVIAVVGATVLVIVWQVLRIGRDAAEHDRTHPDTPPKRQDR